MVFVFVTAAEIIIVVIIIIIIIITTTTTTTTTTTNVEPEMYNYTSNNWSHWNSNEKLKEKFGSCTRKKFDRFTTTDSYTWDITHNTESTAV
jgi:maltose-binding protein MalE